MHSSNEPGIVSGFFDDKHGIVGGLVGNAASLLSAPSKHHPPYVRSLLNESKITVSELHVGAKCPVPTFFTYHMLQPFVSSSKFRRWRCFALFLVQKSVEGEQGTTTMSECSCPHEIHCSDYLLLRCCEVC